MKITPNDLQSLSYGMPVVSLGMVQMSAWVEGDPIRLRCENGIDWTRAYLRMIDCELVDAAVAILNAIDRDTARIADAEWRKRPVRRARGDGRRDF